MRGARMNFATERGGASDCADLDLEPIEAASLEFPQRRRRTLNCQFMAGGAVGGPAIVTLSPMHDLHTAPDGQGGHAYFSTI